MDQADIVSENQGDSFRLIDIFNITLQLLAQSLTIPLLFGTQSFFQTALHKLDTIQKLGLRIDIGVFRIVPL